MIFYFSGTGNSLWAARQIARITGERLVSVCEASPSQESRRTFALAPQERIGFVFPVHAWGPPETVLRFIRCLDLPDPAGHYGYFIATCGDDIGCTHRILEKALARKGIRLHGGFSLQMPNTYVALPGFDTDNLDIQRNKLRAAGPTLEEYGRLILSRSAALKIHPGRFPHVKSYWLRPLFRRYLIQDHGFRTDTSCIACGRCVQACPVGNIRLKEGRPEWLGDCTACLACYHTCPKQAISILDTKNKGQYLHPEFWKYEERNH